MASIPTFALTPSAAIRAVGPTAAAPSSAPKRLRTPTAGPARGPEAFCPHSIQRPRICTGLFLSSHLLQPPQGRRSVTRAEYRDDLGSRRSERSGSGFWAGLVLGGAIGGALAYYFAPQLSKTLLGESGDGSLRNLPKWLGEDDSLEATRRKMNEKLGELNRAIDRASADILGEALGEEGERGRVSSARDAESIDAV